MYGPTLKAVLVMAALAALLMCFPGCTRKGEGEAEGKKSAIVTLITGKEEPPALPPEAEELVGREFAGMDLDVTAAEATDVYLESGDDADEFRDAMVLKQPVFTARTENGHTTEITGERAVLDPENKVVIFDSGATVTGPWENMLECDRLTWYYTRDMLEASEGFTLENGRGITSGRTCVTDIGFKRIKVK